MHASELLWINNVSNQCSVEPRQPRIRAHTHSCKHTFELTATKTIQSVWRSCSFPTWREHFPASCLLQNLLEVRMHMSTHVSVHAASTHVISLFVSKVSSQCEYASSACLGMFTCMYFGTYTHTPGSTCTEKYVTDPRMSFVYAWSWWVKVHTWPWMHTRAWLCVSVWVNMHVCFSLPLSLPPSLPLYAHP
jgi:hypothetical protein